MVQMGYSVSRVMLLDLEKSFTYGQHDFMCHSSNIMTVKIIDVRAKLVHLSFQVFQGEE